jgi:hypothetical protein
MNVGKSLVFSIIISILPLNYFCDIEQDNFVPHFAHLENGDNSTYMY